jgi:hypothetical protein
LVMDSPGGVDFSDGHLGSVRFTPRGKQSLNHGWTRINTDFQIAICFIFRVKQRFCKKHFIADQKTRWSIGWQGGAAAPPGWLTSRSALSVLQSVKGLFSCANFCRERTQGTQREEVLSLRPLCSFVAHLLVLVAARGRAVSIRG